MNDKLPIIPIITGDEIEPAPLPIAVYQCVFRFVEKPFIDTETQQISKGKLWMFVCNNPMNSIYRKGRKVFGENKKYKVRTVAGEIVERESRETKGKVFGYRALADALSARFPITEQRVQELLEDAIRKNVNHVKFCLKSDLVPTSPDRYVGKNEWVLVGDYPKTDVIYQKINEALKESGSTLRVKAGLRFKMVLKE